ncbi:hypothetical protein JCGZ_20066 [Jatropha curcas]|uniref:Organ-specific protein S2 n=1 Tax=Jatropha curcas TaxID=180498 RepID=A0A067L7F6_JATCU|nr:organ-specific protein P4 [Jatropha curcas]KDP44386.1 hypothetical protein JCGZ_20066 [Jatropha curcas]
MKFFFAFLSIFSLILFSGTINARKDVGEYWSGEMKDQPMPEALQRLVGASSPDSFTSTKEKADCHTTDNVEPIPDISIYHNDVILKAKKPLNEKSFLKREFQPRPDVSIYHNDITLKDQNPHLETKSDVTIHQDNIELKRELEPRPDVSIYHSDATPKNDDIGFKVKKSFSNDFQPRPDVSVYGE